MSTSSSDEAFHLISLSLLQNKVNICIYEGCKGKIRDVTFSYFWENQLWRLLQNLHSPSAYFSYYLSWVCSLNGLTVYFYQFWSDNWKSNVTFLRQGQNCKKKWTCLVSPLHPSYIYIYIHIYIYIYIYIYS